MAQTHRGGWEAEIQLAKETLGGSGYEWQSEALYGLSKEGHKMAKPIMKVGTKKNCQRWNKGRADTIIQVGQFQRRAILGGTKEELNQSLK